MKKIYNFSAGPAMLPPDVLKIAQENLVDFKGNGLSVMEMSHRSAAYDTIHKEAEMDLREIMCIPDNYKVLFLQGGATSQFAMVPMNLLKNKAAYIDTGSWSTKAYKEAEKFGKVDVIASTKNEGYKDIPDMDSLKIDPSYDYLHITSNNTIFGTKYSKLPKTDVPIVADMSSFILSETIDVNDYGIIYAGAQKNIGPSGVTIVIIREDLIDENLTKVPVMFDYSIHSKNTSLYNTPPTFAIYMSGLVFKWIKNLGGIKEIEKLNKEKAKLLYEYIDSSKFYNAVIEKDSARSLMNVCFRTESADMDATFIKKAGENNIQNIKGHKSVGGLRASIYNAMGMDGVEYLIEFMKKFENEMKK